MKIDIKELIQEFNNNLKLDYDLKKKNWFNIGGKTKAFYKADNLKLDYDLKKKNWFNIGGKTKAFYKADNLTELIKFVKANIYGKKIVIGMGAGTISTWMRELPKLLS